MHGSNRQAVRERIAALQAQLQGAGQTFRGPPAEPDFCCGRGCNGCVWEGYDAAVQWWLEQAQALADGAGDRDPAGPP